MAEEEQQSQVERWMSFAAKFVTPITLVTALLFYFGYVSARSQYEYFGIDVDTIGLSTQDYVMRSPQPLLVPLLVITLLAVAGLLVHNAIHPTEAGVRRASRATVVLLAIGIAGLLAFPLIGQLDFYGMVVPGVIGLAAATLAYLTHLRRQFQPREGQRSLILLLAVVTVTCAFWATATTAQYTGRGLAKSDAENLDKFPTVILDTKEKLGLRSHGIEETTLRPGAGQTFNYRYHGLRLLVVGENRLFLVPKEWYGSNTTVVIPLDSSVRVQFQFENDPP